jgi:hypothetical protein
MLNKQKRNLRDECKCSPIQLLLLRSNRITSLNQDEKFITSIQGKIRQARDVVLGPVNMITIVI